MMIFFIFAAYTLNFYSALVFRKNLLRWAIFFEYSFILFELLIALTIFRGVTLRHFYL